MIVTDFEENKVKSREPKMSQTSQSNIQNYNLYPYITGT